MTLDDARPEPAPKQAPWLRPVDLLALGFVAFLLALALAALAQGLPGAGAAALRLCWSVAILLTLRSLGWRYEGRLPGLLAAAAPIALAPVDWALDPICDLVNPRLRDGALLAADRYLFGETPSVALQHLLSPLLTEALLIGYLSYFGLLLAPVALLWLRRDDLGLDRYVRLLVVLFVTNLTFYLLVPAVGPRFTIPGAFAAPLHGVFLGDWIHGLFLHTPFFRDCFPSGHTAGTLLALVFCVRRLRAWFFVALPLSVLCVSATVFCRYHYGVDLLCALPLAGWAWAASGALPSAFAGARQPEEARS
jgi:hypothetical protein